MLSSFTQLALQMNAFESRTSCPTTSSLIFHLKHLSPVTISRHKPSHWQLIVIRGIIQSHSVTLKLTSKHHTFDAYPIQAITVMCDISPRGIASLRMSKEAELFQAILLKYRDAGETRHLLNVHRRCKQAARLNQVNMGWIAPRKDAPDLHV